MMSDFIGQSHDNLLTPTVKRLSMCQTLLTNSARGRGSKDRRRYVVAGTYRDLIYIVLYQKPSSGGENIQD